MAWGPTALRGRDRDIRRHPVYTHPREPSARSVSVLPPRRVSFSRRFLYLLAHTCWGTFWIQLLWSQKVEVGLGVGLRAYFVSQFGKYLPGKAMVIVMRVVMLHGAKGGSRLVVGMTATYETLTSMAAGAILAALLLPYLGVLAPALSGKTGWVLLIAGLPLGLGLLNRAAARGLAARRGPDAQPLPSPSLKLLLQGLLQAAFGWCLLALSVELVIRAIAPTIPPWEFDAYLGDLGAVALAYIAGFVILVSPGGLGARELVLQHALRPRFTETMPLELADAQAVVVALVLRLTWTIFEILLALGLWSCRPALHRAH